MSGSKKVCWLSVTQISLLLPWGVVHFNHAFSPLPICDPYPWSLPPLIPCADRPSREKTPCGAEVPDWNFIGPWTCIPGAISALTLEGMRPGWRSGPRLRQTCLGNLNIKSSTMKLWVLNGLRQSSPRLWRGQKVELQSQFSFLWETI